MSANVSEISLLHSFSTVTFIPSGPSALYTFSTSNRLATHFMPSVTFSTMENGQVPFVGRSESASCVVADQTTS